MDYSKYLPAVIRGGCPLCRTDLHYIDTYGIARYYRCTNCSTLVLVYTKAEVVDNLPDKPSMGQENVRVDEGGEEF